MTPMIFSVASDARIDNAIVRIRTQIGSVSPGKLRVKTVSSLFILFTSSIRSARASVRQRIFDLIYILKITKEKYT